MYNDNDTFPIIGWILTLGTGAALIFLTGVLVKHCVFFTF